MFRSPVLLRLTMMLFVFGFMVTSAPTGDGLGGPARRNPPNCRSIAA